jgi:hypothetical protein
MNNQIKFMDCAAGEFNIKEMNDWYNISSQDLCSIGGSTLLKYKYNSKKHNTAMLQLLSNVYPNYNWPSDKSRSSFAKKSQSLLKTFLNSLFPKEGNLLS